MTYEQAIIEAHHLAHLKGEDYAVVRDRQGSTVWRMEDMPPEMTPDYETRTNKGAWGEALSGQRSQWDTYRHNKADRDAVSRLRPMPFVIRAPGGRMDATPVGGSDHVVALVAQPPAWTGVSANYYARLLSLAAYMLGTIETAARMEAEALADQREAEQAAEHDMDTPEDWQPVHEQREQITAYIRNAWNYIVGELNDPKHNQA